MTTDQKESLMSMLRSFKRDVNQHYNNGTVAFEVISRYKKTYNFTMISLIELKIGEKGNIVDLRAEGALKERLKMYGVELGNRVAVVGKTLFGRTILLDVEKTRIGIRKNTANKILVDKIVDMENSNT